MDTLQWSPSSLWYGVMREVFTLSPSCSVGNLLGREPGAKEEEVGIKYSGSLARKYGFEGDGA